jgi:oligopeptide transport system substrate-binding protein
MTRILLAILLIVLAACSDSNAPQLVPGPDRLVRLSDSEIRGLDSQKYSDLASMRIAAEQFTGLTRLDGKGEVQPGLAASWSVSGDGLEWTFTLHQDLKFSDGTPIAAPLFPALWQRLNDSKTASPHIALFQGIAEINANDPDTVQIMLDQPMPKLPALLAHPALAAIPMHLMSSDSDQWTATRPMVASGPYQLVQWRLNDHLALQRNPQWHGPAPAIGQIIWKPVDDPLAAMRLFLAGDADIASDYPQSRHIWLMENRPDAVRTGDYLGSYYFAFNTRQPPFDDINVRLALSMAINREWIARELLPMGNRPAWGVVPPQLREDAGLRPKWVGWSLQKRQYYARQLLEKAGYGPDRPLRFEVRINSSAEHRRIAVAMAAMWEPLGVETQILNSEATLHFSAMRRGEFALARSGWIADLPAPENFLSVHRSDAGAINYSGLSSAPFDRALDAALAQPDPEKRQAAMRRAEAILMAQTPVIPLYYYKAGSLVSSRVQGWHDNAGNIHPSAALSLQQP